MKRAAGKIADRGSDIAPEGRAAASPPTAAPPKVADRRRGILRGSAGGTIRMAAGKLVPKRASLLGAAHLVVFALVYWLAFAVRFDDFVLPSRVAELFWVSLPWVLAVKLMVFFLLGHFHGWWSHVTFADLVALLRASILSFLVVAVTDYFFSTYHIPRGVLILDCMFAVVALGAMRGSWRLFREHFRPIFDRKETRWTLLVGADISSGILAHQIQSNFQLAYRIRGFLAIDSTKNRSRLGQLPILGSVEDVCQIAAATRATDVLVTAGTLPGPRLRRLMEACDKAALTLKIIPPLEERLNGDCRIPIRNLEINDLLRREPVHLDTKTIGKLLEGRRVMVTGAGGSIGSEICRQVLKFNPRSLVLVGRGENRIFMIERELRAQYKSAVLYACIGDVTDKGRMQHLFAEHRPEVVFHAAAHKHVPLMESNVGEAIKNNVFGTKGLTDLADEFGVLSFVFISTDKAVQPSSVMGVSKQIAERYVHALSQESATRFMVVRFGNVLGSDGSVVPVFQEQIRRGGPITITDPRMTRFFMTIPEASQLVLQAAAMGDGGEIFVLEMGEPVKIVDLARDLIRLSGLPENAIEIVFTGVRPGEKLFEELYFDDEQTLPTAHPKLRAAYHRCCSVSEVRHAVAELERLIDEPEEVIRRKLHQIVPEYLAASLPAGEVEGCLPPAVQGLRLHQCP
jgi:FlaA1/EpsC-like NDP-sugar epimerase